MGAGFSKHSFGEHQRGLFGTGEEGGRMASIATGVPGNVSTGQTPRPISQDGDSTAVTTSRPDISARFLGPTAEDIKQLRLCAGREIWRKRKSQTPTGRITWGEWFKQKFGITLEQLTKETKQERENG